MTASSENLVEKLARFQSALNLFVERIVEDKNILAAVLVGTLNEETIWRKDQLYLWLIEVDGVTKRLKSDGERTDIFRWLCEEGINLHVHLIPRSRFRKMVEGTSRTSFSCNFFAKRELVHCKDASIEKWFRKADTAATKDREKELLATTTWAIHAVRHAEKQLQVKQDLEMARQTLLWGAHSMAAMEVVRSGEIYEHEAIYRAIEIDPQLFQTVYVEVLAKKSKRVLLAALDAMNQYLEEHWEANLKPLTYFLKKHGGTVPLTEISEHFAYSQLHPWHLESACEWLEAMGLVEKFSAPFKLTKKSRVDVEEPAYMILD